ncbi:hypothetical protein EDC04DRAFT_2718160 [Pisolithus marmoratus]|nr:hypothetical protein EDC04DRAFT_2718160 [Pisolithus marmoratus]
MSSILQSASPATSTAAAGPASVSAAPTTSAAATTSPVTSASQSASASQTTATSSSSNASASSVTSTTAASTAASSSQLTSTIVVPATVATSQVETTSGGSVYTVVVTSTTTPTSASSNSSGSTSFWDNTGAVVGVFTVVGLIGLALLILIITTAIRRRRAIKFDKEIAAAAADAAATTRFPFDDYSDPNGGGYGYSDNSHGTYTQPPVRQAESYGMTEMSQFDPYAAGATAAAAGGAAAFQRSRSRKESEVGAPGIAGVGAGNLAREPSRRAPYHAFAGPNPHDMNDPAANVRYPRSTTTQDVLEAAGLAASTGAAALPNNGTGAFVSRRPSDYTQNTHQSGRSHGHATSSEGSHPTPLQPGYRPEPNAPQRSNSRVMANTSDPYGVYAQASYPPQAPTPPPRNPLRATTSPPPPNDYYAADHEDQHLDRPAFPPENRMSLQDDTDYAQEPRVLRIMNE